MTNDAFSRLDNGESKTGAECGLAHHFVDKGRQWECKRCGFAKKKSQKKGIDLRQLRWERGWERDKWRRGFLTARGD